MNKRRAIQKLRYKKKTCDKIKFSKTCLKYVQGASSTVKPRFYFPASYVFHQVRNFPYVNNNAFSPLMISFLISRVEHFIPSKKNKTKKQMHETSFPTFFDHYVITRCSCLFTFSVCRYHAKALGVQCETTLSTLVLYCQTALFCKDLPLSILLFDFKETYFLHSSGWHVVTSCS